MFWKYLLPFIIFALFFFTSGPLQGTADESDKIYWYPKNGLNPSSSDDDYTQAFELASRNNFAISPINDDSKINSTAKNLKIIINQGTGFDIFRSESIDFGAKLEEVLENGGSVVWLLSEKDERKLDTLNDELMKYGFMIAKYEIERDPYFIGREVSHIWDGLFINTDPPKGSSIRNYIVVANEDISKSEISTSDGELSTSVLVNKGEGRLLLICIPSRNNMNIFTNNNLRYLENKKALIKILNWLSE